jgi:protein-disulfide isomerase
LICIGENKLSLSISFRDHRRGPDHPAVTLLEYGDYQCSYCRLAYPVIEEIQKQLPDRLQFVYRHFPISEIHPFAQNAAEAAESSSGQGKFWEMHSQLFTRPSLVAKSLRNYARDIGLDTRQFDFDLDSHSQAGRVREDFQSGVESGVQGTPSFFINGVLYNGSWELQDLLSAIKARMK